MGNRTQRVRTVPWLTAREADLAGGVCIRGAGLEVGGREGAETESGFLRLWGCAEGLKEGEGGCQTGRIGACVPPGGEDLGLEVWSGKTLCFCESRGENVAGLGEVPAGQKDGTSQMQAGQVDYPSLRLQDRFGLIEQLFCQVQVSCLAQDAGDCVNGGGWGREIVCYGAEIRV